MILIVKVSMLSAPIFAQSETLFLAKGEQKTLSTQQLSHYSIGNKEIISTRLDLKKQQLLIKGKAQGYTDLHIWDRKNHKSQYQVYVLSKKETLKIAQMAQDIQDIGLEVRTLGKKLLLTGKLKNWDDYTRIMELKNEFPKQIILKIHFSTPLLKLILTNLYQAIEATGLTDFKCELSTSQLPTCLYQTFHKDKELEKQILTRFQVKLDWRPKQPYQNYRLTFKILQIELMDGSHFSIGLNKLNALVSDYLSQGPQSLIDNNLIHLEKNTLRLSTLAEPQSYTVLESKAHLSIGVEIPYPVLLEDNRQGLEWKNTGLNIQYVLKGKGSQILLEYHSEVGGASAEGISRRIQKNQLFLSPSPRFTPLFNVYLINESQATSRLPVLSAIPAVGRLFRESKDSTNQKYILGLVKLELAHGN